MKVRKFPSRFQNAPWRGRFTSLPLRALLIRSSFVALRRLSDAESGPPPAGGKYLRHCRQKSPPKRAGGAGSRARAGGWDEGGLPGLHQGGADLSEVGDRTAPATDQAGRGGPQAHSAMGCGSRSARDSSQGPCVGHRPPGLRAVTCEIDKQFCLCS